ncbi:hypothetical protein D0C36_21900 [Mucilaginibacter conchicola]|uniref:DUF2157 domain-containing protein n=1 Tax=Mucilaginibacter conchicola TaxID=2303333 RepID=A0A372NNB9_9SPHI|nr:hypothetical protein [Mucilaginibacter conchicola]RFZ90446.1 hypothetical protein D0C36_21900 [Mucilaginibacter conchicola]
MIIYNKLWLDNLQVVDQLQADHEDGYITKEEFVAIKQKYLVGFYLPKIVGRVGFFILTLIAIALSTGLVSLMAATGEFIESPYWWLFLSFAYYACTELMTKGNKYFHSGIDNALLYYSAGLFTFSIVWACNDPANWGIGYIPQFVILLIAAIFLTLRFADVILAICSCISFFSLIYFTWAKTGSFGLATMPFVMMIAAGAAYFVLTKMRKDDKNTYYHTCIDVARCAALVVLYLAGNYFVVNRLNNELHGLDDSHTQVQLGFFFWAWTMLMPLVLIALGVTKRNRLLLRLGIIIVAAAVATFRNYYHLLPIEAMLTLAGAILLLLAYTVIKYLKTPKHGVTYAELSKASDWDKLNIEGFIISQTATQTPNIDTGQQTTFGGGTGGGGGSSDSF